MPNLTKEDIQHGKQDDDNQIQVSMTYNETNNCDTKIALPYLTGEDSQICLFGVCLFTTYVPKSPSLNVKTWF